MKFIICIQAQNGASIMINIDQVVTVTPIGGSHEGCKITLSTGEAVEVADSWVDVALPLTKE